MADLLDVVVVGAGATGGWAAKGLTETGLTVALLEAGPAQPFGDAPGSGAGAGGAGAAADPARQPIQAHCYAYGPETAHLFVDDLDCPYTTPEGKPFDWIRGRVVGGRLHTWGRMCLRMSDGDFKAASGDGEGIDWPISHADLAPYYDRVERFMRVCGAPAGLAQVPDGDFVEAPQVSAGERAFAAAVEGRWPTRAVIGARVALAPGDAMLAAAERTGLLTLRPDSIASRVLTDGDGRATGVAYVDRESGVEHEVHGRAVVLCASAIESTRLMLNSAGGAHPDGLGNSSGALGRYLMDHTFGIGLDGHFDQAFVAPSEGTLHGLAVPGFRNVTEDGVDFKRSYGVELQVHSPIAGRLGRLRGRGKRQAGQFWMRTFGEVLPRAENRVTIDPGTVDAWGIPVPRIECAYGENEAKMAADQLRTLTEMADAAGLEVETTHAELGPPGYSIHEMGTARMGADPATSVLNFRNQSWDVPNLFVTDGAAFTSGGWQNPTLTMMALTARACDFIGAELSRGEL
jgi:choline dehydrogenase-like flavoprotein